MRGLASFSIILFALMQITQAQNVARHRCWDIEFVASKPKIDLQPPYVLSEADSGLMLVALAKEYLGAPYRYGGKTPAGFDCAGYARFLYLKFGHLLPPYSGGQARVGVEVSDTRNLQPGDLVLFGGRHNKKTVGHTGVVVEADAATGKFRFIHASTGSGVIISRSTEPYYSQRYITARRVFKAGR